MPEKEVIVVDQESETDIVVAEISIERKLFVKDRLDELRSQVGENYLEMGELLQETRAGEYWDQWGFDSFEEWVEATLGFARRKAFYLMKIQNTFEVMLNIPREELVAYDWTKLSAIAEVVDEDNVNEWLDVAGKATVKDLKSVVKDSLAQIAAEDAGEGSVEPPTTEKFTSFSCKLAPAQAENVDFAMQRAAELSESDKRGHCLDFICLEFLSTYGAVGGGDAKADLQHLLDNIAALYGVEVSFAGKPTYPSTHDHED